MDVSYQLSPVNFPSESSPLPSLGIEFTLIGYANESNQRLYPLYHVSLRKRLYIAKIFQRHLGTLIARLCVLVHKEISMGFHWWFESQHSHYPLRYVVIQFFFHYVRESVYANRFLSLRLVLSAGLTLLNFLSNLFLMPLYFFPQIDWLTD